MNVSRRVQEILHAEAKAIQSVVVSDSYDRAIELMRTCSGKIVTTGMGKAGTVAQRFAATLCSTGTPALYIHPGEAAHGDLGAIGPGDCLIAFSNSGKTREVVEMLELSGNIEHGPTIGITSHLSSPLRHFCDVIVEMGEIREPCPLGLTPSASIAVMGAIADALALVLMESKNFTRQQYGLRHHGGYLGRKARLDNA